MPRRILHVDPDPAVREAIGARLRLAGCAVTEAENLSDAQPWLDDPALDLVIVELHLPDGSGLDLITARRVIDPETPILVLSAVAGPAEIVQAVKLGASEVLAKPYDMEEVMAAVEAGLALRAAHREEGAAREAQRRRFGLANIVGESPAMRELKTLVRRVAAVGNTTVLMLGASGTGKDMMARALHYESPRVERPFMNITCTALPETLMESELFGYEKGAFTNATAMKRGLFELADGGTVYLDEIGDMPPVLQGKLLRVLEERAFRRIGGARDIHVDVRVVAGTNRDLPQRIEQGKFREDLYYRLSVVPITVPSLRDRMEDVPRLANHFLGVFNREFRRRFGPLAPDVVAKLLDYDWPGNVRELKNVMERAVLLAAGDEIRPEDFSLGRRAGAPKTAPGGVVLPEGGCVLEEVERGLLRQALERTHGVQTRAAALLGITRDQLRYKAKKHGLE